MTEPVVPPAANTTALFSTALLSAAQMALADRLTVESGISAIALMENAGRPVAHDVRQTQRPIDALTQLALGLIRQFKP